jgi:hypothetical protein
MIEKRYLILPEGSDPVGQVVNPLLRTLNAKPLWGKPAKGLMLSKVDWAPHIGGTYLLTLTITDEFPGPGSGLFWQAADWGTIARAEPPPESTTFFELIGKDNDRGFA